VREGERIMGWDVALQDHAAKPWCDYGTPLDQWVPKYDFETEPCPEPCCPAVKVERHAEGGTYAIGGTSEAEVSITYNYGKHIREAWPEDPDPEASNVLGRMLDGKRAGDVIKTLERAVGQLGTDTDDDYWKPTPGNAGHMLNVLLGWARQHPEAVFKVS
jgi:hypothetical protein